MGSTSGQTEQQHMPPERIRTRVPVPDTQPTASGRGQAGWRDVANGDRAMTTKYERGRDAEYRTINELRADGYDAVRTAGSHGAADVIAWNGVHVRFIQCKTWVSRVGDYRADIQKLEDMRLPPGSQCELWARQIGQRGWAVQRVVRVAPAMLETRATTDQE